MRLLAWAVIIISLVLAIVSAVTAYSPKLTMSDEQLLKGAGGQPLTLGAPAGKQGDGPLARAGDKLSGPLLEQLRASGQNRVRVKEFSFARWSEWWIFAIGCAGMFAGAMLIRRENAREIALADRATHGHGAESSLDTLRAELAELRKQVSAVKDSDARLGLIVERVERITAEHVPPFIDARPKLVARLGLAGYAQLMDRYAAGERQINRAWSAAADGYEGEAIECLDRGTVLFDEAAERMNASR